MSSSGYKLRPLLKTKKETKWTGYNRLWVVAAPNRVSELGNHCDPEQTCSKMSMKSCFFGCWKRNRWKNCKLYSVLRNSVKGHAEEVVSTNILITKHARIGQLDVARELFDGMTERTMVSWNTMISGYSKLGRYSEALVLGLGMHCSGMKLNEISFSTLLSACARSGSLCEGKEMHCLVLKSGFERFEIVGSALVYYYANCFQIQEAERVFNELSDGNELLWSLMLVGYVQCNLMNDAFNVFVKMPNRDVREWTALISGYAKSGDGCGKALELFQWMRGSRVVTPNEFTFDCVIRACSRLGDFRTGRVVHGLLVKNWFEFDDSVGCALIGFYCNCEAFDDAKRVYDKIVNPSLDVSNSLLGGLILMGRVEDAELIFNTLPETDLVSCNMMLKGYAGSGRIEDCTKLFMKMPYRNVISLNTMISVYSRNNQIDQALKLFEETKWERNPVTWNSMISGFTQNDKHEEALRLYITMRQLSVDQTRSTFSTLFRACSCLTSLLCGQLLHAQLSKTPFEPNVYVRTSLIDMYSKCGSVTDAQKSFCSIISPNVAAYTALISGYAHYGLAFEAISLFEHMLEKSVEPNAATIVGILSACGHAGLINEGKRIFSSMGMYKVTPTLEHYTCIVNLLGRSGHLKEAEEFIKDMPIEADGVVWGALFSTCLSWIDMEVGGRVAAKMLSLDPNSISAYITLSNIYSVLGKWDEKMNLWKTLKVMEAKKEPGFSWIEVNNRVNVFSVEDRTHPQCKVIYATLEHLTANVKSVVQIDCVSLPITDATYFTATTSAV